MVSLPNPLVCSPDHVAQAVSVLYGDPNPARKAEANLWLSSFSSSPASWEVGTQLLGAGSVEIQYFSANMLLTKTRMEWCHLSPAVQSNVSSTVLKFVQGYMTDTGAAAVVVNRVCLLAAAIAIRTVAHGGHGMPDCPIPTVDWLLNSCIQAAAFAKTGDRAEQTMAVAIALLLAVAEEVEQVDRCRREATLATMQNKVVEVLGMEEAVFTGLLGNGSCMRPKSRLLIPALQLLQGWLKVDYSGCGRPAMTVGHLAQTRPQLWHFVLRIITSEELQVAEVAVEILVDLLSTNSSGIPAEEAAVKDVTAAVLGNRQRLMQAFKDDEGNSNDMARGLCRVAVAANESAPELIACCGSGWDDGATLAEMVLECGEHGDRATAELAVEFFLTVGTVPVAQRHMALQGPAFGCLLRVTLLKVAYPPDFTSWDSEPEDPDTFYRFRDQAVVDALDNCYNLLRGQYVEFVGTALKVATTWMEVEACLCAMRSIAQSLKERVYNGASPPVSNHPVLSLATTEFQISESFLLEVFTRIAGKEGETGLFSAHPMIVDTSCRFVGAYAWWCTWHKELLEGVLRFVLRALQVPGAWKHASHAFRNVCVRCSGHLKDPTVLEGLIDASKAHLPPIPAEKSAKGGMCLDDRVAVVEGLARIIATLPPAIVPTMISRLSQPMVVSIQQLAVVGGGVGGGAGSEERAHVSEAQVVALQTHLRLLASAIRFLEMSDDPGSPPKHVSSSSQPCASAVTPHPCFMVMEIYWSTLASILNSAVWRREPEVIDALCQVYDRSLLCMKAEAQPMLASLVPPLVDIFEKHQHPAVLDTLSKALEVSVVEGDMMALFGQALVSICQVAVGLLQRGELPDKTDVFHSFFDLAHRYLVFAPRLLLVAPILAILIPASCAVILNKERESSSTSLKFLSHLLSPGDKALSQPPWPELRPIVDACLIQHHGEAVTHALLWSAANMLPRHLIRIVAATTYALLNLYHSQAAIWLVAVLHRPDFPGVQEGYLRAEDKTTFCNIALRQPPLPRQRFESLVTDFAQICRRETTGDALLAYQM